MLFGLFNAPASFQGYINKILFKNLDVFIIVYLDDILIYTEDKGKGHVEAVWWYLDFLKKKGFFANLKKSWFHQDEICFLGYVVLAQEVQMEDKRIEARKNWPEPKSMKYIQVFLGFANFYRSFIYGLSKIAGPPTSMLRTTQSVENLSSLMAEDAEVGNDGSSDYEDEIVERSSLTFKNSNRTIGYLTSKTRLAFM